MKTFRNSAVRAFCALVVGVLLIKYPDMTLGGLTVAIGILFLVAGILSLVSWIYHRRQTPAFSVYAADGTLLSDSRSVFPIVGLGSLIFGAILALMPETFVRLQMYVVAAMLILGALNLYMNLVAARTLGRVGLMFWAMPTVVLLAGIFVMVRPMQSAELPLVILGWSLLLFGVTEVVNAIKFHSLRRASERVAIESVEEAEATAEPSAEE